MSLELDFEISKVHSKPRVSLSLSLPASGSGCTLSYFSRAYIPTAMLPTTMIMGYTSETVSNMFSFIRNQSCLGYGVPSQ